MSETRSGALRVDRNGCITWAGDSACHVVNAPATDLRGRRLVTLFATAAVEEAGRTLDQGWRDGAAFAGPLPLAGEEGRNAFLSVARADDGDDLWTVIHLNRRLQRLISDLERERQRYQSLFAHHPDAVYELDADGRFLSANPGLGRLLRVPPDMLASTTFEPYTHEDDLPRVLYRFRKALDGEPQNYEVRAYRHDGELMLINITNVPIVIDGRTEGVFGIARDVTAAREATRKLREAEDFSRVAMDSVPGIFYVISEDRRFVRWNRNLETVLGYSAEELPTKNPLDMVDLASRERIEQEIRRVFEEGAGQAEADLHTADGRFIPHYFSGRLLDLDDRRYLVGMAIDLSELKATEQALRDSERRYRVIAEQSGMGILRTDDNGCVLYANPAMHELLGLSPDEDLTARGLEDFLVDDPARALPDSRGVDSIGGLELQLRSDSGELRDVLWSADRLTGEGRDTGIVITAIDVTDRRRAEEGLRQSEERFRIVAEQTGEMIYDVDLVEGTVRWDGAIGDVIGLTRADLDGETVMEWEARLHPEDLDRFRRERDRARGECGRFRLEYRLRRKEGHYIYVEDSGVYLPDAAGEPVRLLGALADVTEARRRDQELRLAANALGNIAEGVVITDGDDRIVSVNDAMVRISGFERDELIGENLDTLRSGRHGPEFHADLRNTVRRDGVWQGEIFGRRKNGEVYPSLVTMSAVSTTDMQRHFVITINDISTHKAYEERLDFLSYHDPLTELPNRNLFHKRVERAVREAGRRHEVTALLFIDLDQFKNVNDSLGHVVGDDVLRDVALRLSELTSADDTVARLGGDEFGVLLEGLNHADDAALVAQKLLNGIRKGFFDHGQEFHPSASIGISCYPENGESFEALMKHGEMAMYQAKQSGRNTYRYFSVDMNRHARERLLIANSIQRGLGENEFFLEYQPRLHMGTGEMLGSEALVRWHHPELGRLAPDRFIPVAEDTGMIGELGEWVLDEVCRQTREWLDEGIDPGRLAVNLSAGQLGSADLPERIHRIMTRRDVTAANLEFEVTETMMMRDPDKARELLVALKEMGFRIAVDDFGTGYSSLGYLRMFPIDTLKIDRSFVENLPDDRNSVAITRGIIALSGSMGLTVVAEGIETDPQREFLVREGCPEGQGFHFSRPVPPGDLVEWQGAHAARTGATTD